VLSVPSSAEVPTSPPAAIRPPSFLVGAPVKAANREPSPDDKQKLSVANLNDIKAKQIEMEVAGTDAESQLDFMSMAAGDPKVYS